MGVKGLSGYLHCSDKMYSCAYQVESTTSFTVYHSLQDLDHTDRGAAGYGSTGK